MTNRDIDPAIIDDLVDSNHILYQQGVVDGFGHVSVRSPANPNHFLIARSMAPALVTAADIMTIDLDSNPVGPNPPASYAERFIHAEIYRARPEIVAVSHSHSPSVIPFGIVPDATLKAVSHMGAFIGEGAPVFEIRDTAGTGSDMLVRSPELGKALARSMGRFNIVLMRGHGSTVVGSTLRQAVYRAIYAEWNAKLQLDALRLGSPIYLTREESENAARTNDAAIDRAWQLWKRAVREARGGFR